MERSTPKLDRFSQWPCADRIAAIRQLLPKADLDRVLADGTRPERYCRRLPGWFVLWFVVAIGLFSRDSYRQVFKWPQPFRPNGTPGRSTLCMARLRPGVAPLYPLLERAISLPSEPSTPGCFHISNSA